MHGGNRHVMLKLSGAKQTFLLSPQSSALITDLLTLNTDTLLFLTLVCLLYPATQMIDAAFNLSSPLIHFF
jgi:hypothetical protein